MNNILGFIILSLPILIPIVLVIAGLSITCVIANRLKVKRKKMILWVMGIFISLSIPFGDEVLGHVYFNYLCASDSGSIVYKQAELPLEYWDKHGRPSGAIRYGFKREENNQVDYVKIFRINKIVITIKDSKSNVLLGQLVDYQYRGGWIINMLRINAIKSCLSGGRVNSEFMKSIFIKDDIENINHGEVR